MGQYTCSEQLWCATFLPCPALRVVARTPEQNQKNHSKCRHNFVSFLLLLIVHSVGQLWPQQFDCQYCQRASDEKLCNFWPATKATTSVFEMRQARKSFEKITTIWMCGSIIGQYFLTTGNKKKRAFRHYPMADATITMAKWCQLTYRIWMLCGSWNHAKLTLYTSVDQS